MLEWINMIIGYILFPIMVFLIIGMMVRIIADIKRVFE